MPEARCELSPNSILFHHCQTTLTDEFWLFGCRLRQDPNDIVITLALRTPLCKYKTGSLRDTPLDALVFKTLEQVRKRCNLDPSLVGDVCLGNVRDGKAGYYCRAALLAAGFPNTTCASHASRFCSSGLTATQHIANEIITGTIDVGGCR